MAFPDAFKNAKKKMKGKKSKPEPKKGDKKGDKPEPKKGKPEPKKSKKNLEDVFLEEYGEGNPFDALMKKEEE